MCSTNTGQNSLKFREIKRKISCYTVLKGNSCSITGLSLTGSKLMITSRLLSKQNYQCRRPCSKKKKIIERCITVRFFELSCRGRSLQEKHISGFSVSPNLNRHTLVELAYNGKTYTGVSIAQTQVQLPSCKHTVPYCIAVQTQMISHRTCNFSAILRAKLKVLAIQGEFFQRECRIQALTAITELTQRFRFHRRRKCAFTAKNTQIAKIR